MNKNVLVALGVVGAMAAGGAIYTGVGGGEAAAAIDAAAIEKAAAEVGTVTMYRSPGCGCCDTYAEYLEAHGFDVELVDDPDFDQRSIAVGVPQQGLGCHLTFVDDYAVSGLVPADIITRLLQERPEITGITLPGMPGNAPGMAEVKTGTLKLYAFGPDGVSVYSEE